VSVNQVMELTCLLVGLIMTPSTIAPGAERLYPMHSPDDQAALNALAFLARTGSQIDAFRNQLKQAADLPVASFVECRYYGSDLYVCVCLEADVAEGKTLTWWLDITPKDTGWRVEASVLWNGRDVVAQVPGQLLPDFQAVQQAVPVMLKQLLDAGGHALARARQPATAPPDDALSTRALD